MRRRDKQGMMTRVLVAFAKKKVKTAIESNFFEEKLIYARDNVSF